MEKSAMRHANVAGAIRLPALICALFLFAASVSAPAQAANQPPTISGTPPSWVYVGSQYYFVPSAADPESATLRFSITNKPSWATFSTYTGRLTGTPGKVGLWSNIRISVTDGTSKSSLAFSIRATARDNTPPTISGAPATSVVAGSAYSFVPSAVDPNGDTLRFSIVNRPAWASFSSTTGQLTGTPTLANVGTYSGIAIAVSDGTTPVPLPAFSITVSGVVNRAPTISGTPATSVTEGQAYSFVPTAADEDKNTLGFSIQNKPTWATFSSATGQLSGTPTAASVGSYANIVISVSDGKVAAALAPFDITVAAIPNKAPTISGAPTTSVNANSAYNFRPTAADGDGDTLTFSVANRPAWATFNAATGQLSGTPAAASVGTYSNIVISVSDGKASVALPGFSITVADVSPGAASLSWIPPTTNTDGSTLTNLAGYRIVYGTSAAQLTQTIQLSNPGMSSYIISNLAPGTYYFAVRAYTSAGAESTDSNVIAKSVQ
jgi:hypothetical protein